RRQREKSGGGTPPPRRGPRPRGATEGGREGETPPAPHPRRSATASAAAASAPMANTMSAAKTCPLAASAIVNASAAPPASSTERWSRGATSEVHSHSTPAAATPQNKANGHPPR